MAQQIADSIPVAGSKRRARSAAGFGRLLVVPTAVALLAVVGFPLLFALFVSTHDYDLTEGGIGAFVGLGNYAATFANDLFAVATRNTLVYSASVVVIELLVALGLSVILNQQGLRFRNVYLAILLIPLLVSPVAVGLIWRLLLHPELGAVNWMLGLVGLPPQEWLGGKDSALPTVIGVDVWHETSLMIVIILAGLEGVMDFGR